MAKSRSKSPSRSILLLIFVVIIAVLGLIAAIVLSSSSQDLRQQAAGCQENQVNVEFRKYTGKDGPGWDPGTSFKSVKTGDRFDVNCFSKTGTALLTNGKFTVKLDGKAVTLPASAFKTSTEIRGWTIDKPGKWSFTCSNNAACTNTDTLTVTGAAVATPTPAPATPTPPPQGNPGSCPLSDLNKDCKTTLQDYDLFLKDFREHFNK